MNVDWSLTPATLWLLLGVLLILSEFAFAGIIAVFFGAAAILVALLLLAGVDLSLNAQILLFAGLGLALLLAARNRLKGWFRGGSDPGQFGVEVLPPGTPVVAAGDFVDGRGVVHYRGARWEAESGLPVTAGQRVYTTGRRGLVLTVEPGPPAGS